MLDVIVKGGRIIDPANGRDAVADIGFGAGKVVAVGAGLPLQGSEIIGHLAAGAVGDATILELVEGLFDFRDVLGETRRGRQRFAVRGLVVAGRPWRPPQQ